MVQLIPDSIPASTNYGEKVLFGALNEVKGKDDWIVLHGLHQYKVVQGVETEGDFIVLIPGKGIVAIESKGAMSAEINGENWELVGVPEKAKNKSPIAQVEHVRNNIRQVINTNEINGDSLPIARVVWFPKMDPKEFDGVGNKGMEFYPWEILFKRDIPQIVEVIEDAINQETRLGAEKGLAYRPEKFDAKEMGRIRDILRIRAKASVSKDGITDIRKVQLQGSTDYLLPLWDAISSNQYFYIEGAAGTGKSMMLKHAADTFASQGRKVLVTCNSLMMADELALKFEYQPNVDVIDIAKLFLEAAQLKQHKKGDAWYDDELPTKAKNAVSYNPQLAKYDVICVDEFQDIASRPKVIDALFRFFGGEGDFEPAMILVGDDYQQIMNNKEPVVGIEAAKEVSGWDFVHVWLTRNCRQAPGLSHAIFEFLKWDDRGFKHELNKNIEWSLKVVRTKPDTESAALSATIKELLETNSPENIRVLSPFGEQKSLLAKVFQKTEHTKDEQWLMEQVRHKDTSGEIRWRSIPKFKGLEEDVIVITDINHEALDFAASINQTLDSLLYVGLTRAKFHVVLLIEEGLYPHA
jgi:hypothetical protein